MKQHAAIIFPLNTKCKLNVHEMFGKRPGHFLNLLYILNLLPLSKELNTFLLTWSSQLSIISIISYQLSQLTLSQPHSNLKQSPPPFEEVKTLHFWKIKMSSD